MNINYKRDPVPPLTCLVLLLSALWANLNAEQVLMAIPLDETARATSRGSQDLALGSQAPDFRLRDVDGKWIQLSALRGHHVLLFFASDCTSCSLGEAAQLDTLYAKRSDAVLAVIAPVSSDEMRDLRKERGYDALLIPSVGSDVEKRYKVAFLPRLYVLDKSGHVRYVQPAGVERTQVQNTVEKLIGSKGAL